ncbi:hypothetical protein JCM11641_001036 [Rhodosporidiobolus odoratus]
MATTSMHRAVPATAEGGAYDPSTSMWTDGAGSSVSATHQKRVNESVCHDVGWPCIVCREPLPLFRTSRFSKQQDAVVKKAGTDLSDSRRVLAIIPDIASIADGSDFSALGSAAHTSGPPSGNCFSFPSYGAGYYGFEGRAIVSATLKHVFCNDPSPVLSPPTSTRGRPGAQREG